MAFFNATGMGGLLNGNGGGEWIYHILQPRPDHIITFQLRKSPLHILPLLCDRCCVCGWSDSRSQHVKLQVFLVALFLFFKFFVFTLVQLFFFIPLLFSFSPPTPLTAMFFFSLHLKLLAVKVHRYFFHPRFPPLQKKNLLVCQPQ